MMPTMTSATMRPPTSPRWSPAPRTAASRRMYSHSGVSSCQSPMAISSRVSAVAPTAWATASPDGNPVPMPRCRSRAASDWYAPTSTTPVMDSGRDQRRGQLSIDRLGPLGRRVAWHVKQKRPIDDVLRRRRPEPSQVGKDGKARATLSQLIVAFDLRMAVAVGGVGKFNRDEGFAREAVEARTIAQDGCCHRITDEVREEIMEDDPLVVPTEGSARIVE